MKVLITGGAGFIGSALIRYLIKHTHHTIVNLDKLTYAAHKGALSELEKLPRYTFEQADIGDTQTVSKIFQTHRPDAVMHLAAETHIDRSIQSAHPFIKTNIEGTYHLLEATRAYWETLSTDVKKLFRFHHVSTDEVYGDLASSHGFFSEKTRYDPHNPYAASKAASDHLVRAWHCTYGLPIVLSHSTNNYGEYQYPEKLIPFMISQALQGKQLTIYGNGDQRRDWMYVDDHAAALYRVLQHGEVGSTYTIGANQEISNLDLVHMLCVLLEELAPIKPRGVQWYRELICFVQDRPGHDVRYGIDATKIKKELGWQPLMPFTEGLRKTVQWYVNNAQRSVMG